jgi:hypothetical protein
LVKRWGAGDYYTMSRLFELLQGVDELGNDYSADYVTKRYYTMGSVSTLTK